MTRDIGTWLMVLGGIAIAFGGLRVYSVAFADPAAAADIRASEGGIWIAAVGVGVVLLIAGWWLRRSRQTA